MPRSVVAIADRLAREGFTIAAPGPLQQVQADIFARKIVDRVMPGL
jgi:hypothetical protein